MRTPAYYLPHGGGPWPFMDWPAPIDAQLGRLRAWLERLPRELEGVRGLVVVSAHWEAPSPSVYAPGSGKLLYDYGGFPPHTYRLSWPARGDEALAARIDDLVGGAERSDRGYDHGTFVPLMVAWPAPAVPVVQLSLLRGLDPAAHVELGRQLAPLREEGIALLGSGMSYHHMGGFMKPWALEASRPFDAWLAETVALDAGERGGRLARWAEAPGARASHPREEHLLPLMVVAGAAGVDRGEVVFREQVLGAWCSGVRFGTPMT